MAEVLLEFDDPILRQGDTRYTARVCGRDNGTGLWEGWIEFVPSGGGPAVETGQETTQPNRDDLVYWATGLTATYLDGALQRALKPSLPPLPREYVDATPQFDGPARRHQASAPASYHAVLDPFAVYRQSGDTVLRDQLGALDAGQLRNIVKAYSLSTAPDGDVDGLTKPVLVDLIMKAAESRTA